jgi:hypothetical protein
MMAVVGWIAGWSFFGFSSNLKDMVGPWGLEPQTAATATLRTPPWLPSGRGGRGRRLSRA